jgi:hypothetical protein
MHGGLAHKAVSDMGVTRQRNVSLSPDHQETKHIMDQHPVCTNSQIFLYIWFPSQLLLSVYGPDKAEVCLT